MAVWCNWRFLNQRRNMKKSREGNWDNHQDLSLFFSAAVFSSVCMEPQIAQQKAQESRLKPKTWRKRTFREKIAFIWQSTRWNHLVARKLSALCPIPRSIPWVPFFCGLVIKEWSLTLAGNWNISIYYCLQICQVPCFLFSSTQQLHRTESHLVIFELLQLSFQCNQRRNHTRIA